MKKTNFLFKTLAFALVILCLFPLLISCKGRPLAQTRLAKKEVGSVGNYTVLYEEFYFVANNYYNSMKEQYKDDAEGLKKAVWEKTCQSLASNYYAILTLCESEGIIYDEKELKKDVEAYVENQIKTEFDGSRSDYFKSQKQAGITDHYVRFTIGTDMLYNRLSTQYKESGVIPNTDEKITKYIKENLIHTWHLAVVVNPGDDRAEKLAKAEDLLEKLNRGESFFNLMKYSEDFSSNTMSGVDGTYFHKGEMTKEYEDASLALRVNEYSDIVTSTAKQNDGSMLECFYIIQRLPVKDEDIEANFHAMSDAVSAAIIVEKVQSVKDSLVFTPNEYAKNLDVTKLEQPKNGADYQLILALVGGVLACAVTVTLIIVLRMAKTKRFHQQIRKK